MAEQNIKMIKNMTLDGERALYGSENIRVENCSFDGPRDGESAFKESRGVVASNCYFNLRYPFWHVEGLTLASSEMTELCRAALWYSNCVSISSCRLHGIKALRECGHVELSDCDIISPEFGWFNSSVKMKNCSARGEYFMMRSTELDFENVILDGKYSFQYVENATFNNCRFDTKDAFWHAKNVTVRNSVIKGEYLGWYCEDVTFINCKIIGTQPLCYCKNLKLVDCEMEKADLCFEKSDVVATLTAPVISIKNPHSGRITVPSVGELVLDDERAEGVVVTKE